MFTFIHHLFIFTLILIEKGYSLTYSESTSPFLGNLSHAGLRDTFREEPSSRGSTSIVPILSEVIFQGAICCTAVSLTVGCINERGRYLPMIIFIFIWTTVVYDPVAYWHWNPNGWLAKLGVLDFAGGTPVHVLCGVTALAYSYLLGKRIGLEDDEVIEQLKKNDDISSTDESIVRVTIDPRAYGPHNNTFIIMGTTCFWIGWLGFNSGNAYSPNITALVSIINTLIGGSFGGFTWCLMDYRIDNKFSVVGFCSGVIAGLCVVTPGSGYIPIWASVIFGCAGGIICNFSTRVKYLLNIDDALDVFAVHGVGGMVGNILTGIFAADYIVNLTENDLHNGKNGGWITHNWVQLGYQIAGIISSSAYTFVVSFIILWIINKIPGLHLRVRTRGEVYGLDDIEHGEFAYDYVEVLRNVPTANLYHNNESEEINGTSVNHNEHHHTHISSASKVEIENPDKVSSELQEREQSQDPLQRRIIPLTAIEILNGGSSVGEEDPTTWPNSNPEQNIEMNTLGTI